MDVVVTEKMDGENCTMHKGGIYARSIDSDSGVLRQRVKTLWSVMGYDIPDGWRICGENLQWQHSIRYENLISPFYVFSIWNEKDECLSWDETIDYCQLLNLPTVPVLFRGSFNEDVIRNIAIKEGMEGYVVRNSLSFHYDAFSKNLAKFVRANHVQTDQHWSKHLVENGFSNECSK